MGVALGSRISRRSRHLPSLWRSDAMEGGGSDTACHRQTPGRARARPRPSGCRPPAAARSAHATVRALTRDQRSALSPASGRAAVRLGPTFSLACSRAPPSPCLPRAPRGPDAHRALPRFHASYMPAHGFHYFVFPSRRPHAVAKTRRYLGRAKGNFLSVSVPRKATAASSGAQGQEPFCTAWSA